VPCPAGRYGASHGLADAACDGPAAPGYWTSAASTNATAQRCGSSTVFCPSGSAAPLPVASGHYSTDVNTAHLAPSVSAPSVATDGHVVNAEALTEKEARAANVAKYASAEERAAIAKTSLAKLALPCAEIGLFRPGTARNPLGS